MNPRKPPSVTGALFAALVIVITAHANVERPESGEVVIDTDHHGLVGTWEIDFFEVKGNKLPMPQGQQGTIVFAADGKVIVKNGVPKNEAGTYKINLRKTPKEIDLIEMGGGAKKGRRWRASSNWTATS
jgi:uncharacterized protein (TIGR03067 family)